MYDLIIIGGGPAGISAGVYAARKRLKTNLITFDWGGQSIVSTGIQNWIGFVEINGEDLAKKLKEHLYAYKSDILDITEGEKVVSIKKEEGKYVVTTDSGKVIESKAILSTAGSNRKKLKVEGADTYEHKGLTYCASCDGPMFGGQDVVVIGGGNSALESAAQLAAYAKSVTILQRSDVFRADPITVEKVLSNPIIKGITGTEIIKIEGEQFVTSITYKIVATGEIIKHNCAGIFVEIGHEPNTIFLKDLVNLNENNEVIVNPKTQQTSDNMIWAAGDCTDAIYRQIGIASGDAIRALEDIYSKLKA